MTTKLFTAVFATALVLTPVAAFTPADTDVTALAQMAYGEAQGLADHEIAAVMWIALNRLDAGYADTVLGVVTAPGQFAGYDPDHPVMDRLSEIARDVLTRHYRERQGLDVPREIGPDYFWFSGDGIHNYFRSSYMGRGVLPEEVTE